MADKLTVRVQFNKDEFQLTPYIHQADLKSIFSVPYIQIEGGMHQMN